MKTNLSSQITLTRIPTRYYRPENAFEHSVLTRLEKVPTTIFESMEEGSFAVAKEIAAQIRKNKRLDRSLYWRCQVAVLRKVFTKSWYGCIKRNS